MSVQARLPLPSFTRKRKRSFGMYLRHNCDPRRWLTALVFSADQNEPIVRGYFKGCPIYSDVPCAGFLVYNADDYDALTITSWWQAGRPSNETWTREKVRTLPRRVLQVRSHDRDQVSSGTLVSAHKGSCLPYLHIVLWLCIRIRRW